MSKNHKITSTNIAKKLLLQRCSKPLFSAFFNFSHKRPTFAFMGESGYTLTFAQRIAHNGTHAETGGLPDGAAITTLGVLCVLPKRRTAACQSG